MDRGFAFDIAILMVFLFFLVMTGVTVYFVGSQILAGTADTSSAWAFTAALAPALSAIKGVFDGMSILLLIVFTLGIIATSELMYASTFMLVVGIILMIITVEISMMLSNVYSTFASNATISATANQFVISAYVMNYLPYWVVAIFAISLIYFYSKRQNDG